MPPKPALKKTAVAANAPPTQRALKQRHLETAVHHANLLEQRKQVELDVLKSIIELMDFPTAPVADVARPSASDALRFREAIIPFQPSDYDALIEERNLAGKCGYTLCPQPKGKAPSTARKHVVLPEDCARRALFVKVQLNEEPAWLRQGGYGIEIELMVENAEEHHKALPLRLKKETRPPPPPTEEEDAAAAWAARDDALADLAMERGEKPGRLSKANKDLIQDRIKERVAKFPPVPPSLPDQRSGQSHLAIEGHVPKAATGAEQAKDSDEDEDDQGGEQDWDKHLPG
ncbi:hypothetical protein N0V90_009978 [Kalmusia sp. IMI 367209]|nr:hypothetical protein N0V90_009978 [Kalmusia sp. IMI 367209]